MIIRIEDLKNICSTILTAVDSSELSKITETLELKVEDSFFYMNVTNKEYYARVKMPISIQETMHATVNANLFLKLIAQTTSETVELTNENNYLKVKGNGEYKLPLIFDEEGNLLDLPEINIDNVTSEFEIDSETLNSILKFNSKELTKGIISKPVQKLYYIDNSGCITFTSGACVNNFTLDNPIKILLNNKIVKLFKLFKSGKVNFSLGHDAISESIIQTKVRFETDDICITAIISNDDSLLNSVPVKAIRDRANTLYDYSVSLNRLELLDCINRLMLFSSGISGKDILKPYSSFEFNKEYVTVYSVDHSNSEQLYYNKSLNIEDKYDAILDLVELKATLDNCTDQYITIRFGNHQAIVIARNNILNVIPECRVS